MLIYLFLFVSVLLWILSQSYNNIKFWQKVNRIPILPGLPLIGVAHEAIGGTQNFFKLCMALAKMEAPILGVWFGPKYYVRVKDPVHIQTILNSSQCLDKGSDAVKINNRWIGTGLEMSPGHIWKGHRKTIAHCFNTITLQSFLNVFERQTEKTINDLKLAINNNNNHPINILIHSCSYSLRSICETTFGIKSALDNTECIEFIDASHTLVKILMKRITNLIYYFDWMYFITPLYRHEKRTLEKINSFTQKLILEKKQNVELMTMNKLKLEQFEDGLKKSNIFLEQLITNTNFSNQLIEHQVNVMIFAGHETSGSALAFTILMLAIHQDIQKKVLEEIFQNLNGMERKSNNDELIGIDTDSDSITNNLQMDDLKKFTYLEMVIFETLRLFPVGPLLSRYTTEDLKLGDITIPSGVDIFILIYGLHRDVNYWGMNADKFNPDNFLPEAIAKRHPFSFIPFSAGPRNCIGYKYAMLSMKIFLIRLLQQFEFTTHLTFDDVRVKQELVLKIDGEHTVYLSKR